MQLAFAGYLIEERHRADLVVGKGARRKTVLIEISEPRLDSVFEKHRVLQVTVGVTIAPTCFEPYLEHRPATAKSQLAADAIRPAFPRDHPFRGGKG
jgi:hypothetical protein